MTTPGGPLERAREALLQAKEAQSLKDTPAHRQAVEEARVHLDYLLDTLPQPPAVLPSPDPDGPGASHPGPSVFPYFRVGGDHDE